MFRVAPYNQVQVKRRNEFDQLFNMMDKAFANEPRKEFVRGFKVDIIDQEDSYVFEADLPGITKEEISVDYVDNQLVLKVEVKEVEENEEKKEVKYIRRERSTSSMKRVFSIKDIQQDEISAKFENGVLTVVAPKLVEVDTSVSIDIK